MDIRRMLIFRTVARSGSIAGAARELGWTQPAVSQHLRQLEREVRCPLVIREARGVRLTEAGEALLAHADAIATRLRSAKEELAALVNLRSGTVRVASFPSASATIVPTAMAALADRHPGLTVQLREAEPPEALDSLRAGEVDLALVFAYPQAVPFDRSELTVRPLGDDPILAVLPSEHPLSAAGRLRLAQLAGERWIAGCVRCREHLLELCARAGFTPDVRHMTDDYVVVQSLVAAGVAVALLPELAVRAYRHPGVSVVDADAGPRKLMLAHHREAVRTPAVAVAVTALSDAADRSTSLA